MNATDAPDHQPEPAADDLPVPAPESHADVPSSRAVTPIGMTILGEPPILLTDPPTIIGGASHTW